VESEVRSKFAEATKLLQMPPVLKIMEDNCKELSHDAALKNYSPYTYIFTDISLDKKNADRLIVVRNPDGTLKEAPYDIKKRCWQIYFPVENRRFREPKMFEPENFKRLLSEGQYAFILDIACTQYEPYEPKYHSITSQVYLHINEHLKFDELRSTRHFGPMAFFFAWHKTIDEMLLDMIRNDYLKNAVQLICLMYKLNDIKDSTAITQQLKMDEESENQIKFTIQSLLNREDSVIKKIEKSDDDLRTDEICFEFIQDYVNKYSQKKPQLELVLQTYKEWHNELKNIKKGFQTN
jgi:small subunit ribosomal protein S22